jgi:heptosyltransferase III
LVQGYRGLCRFAAGDPGRMNLKSARHNAIPEPNGLRKELEEIPRLLLLRLRSLGDAILTLPLIDALHKWRPDLKQSILIEAPFAPLFIHHPAIDETLVVRSDKMPDAPGWNRLRAACELRKRRYPAVLNLHGGTTSMLFTLASGAPIRLGQASHRRSWLYTKCIPSSNQIWNRARLHTVEHQLSLLRWLDIPYPDQPAALCVDESSRNRVHKRLHDAGIFEFFLIQPTATLATKQWAPENFAALGDRLRSEYRIPVIYSAARHEAVVLERVRHAAQEGHTYWSDLSLMELCALIERCSIFIGCDSGPTHAAAALNKPLVVVWGSSDFDAWHPWQTEYEAVRSDLPCIPCPGYRCDAFGEPKCIMEIPVSRVEAACRKIVAISNR